MADINWPTSIVDAAARALHEHDRAESIGEPAWDGLEDPDRDTYRATVRAVLAAGLDGCEISEQIEVQTPGLRYPCANMSTAWRQFGELKAGGYDTAIVTRIVWSTPWAPIKDVPAEDVPGGAGG